MSQPVPFFSLEAERVLYRIFTETVYSLVFTLIYNMMFTLPILESQNNITPQSTPLTGNMLLPSIQAEEKEKYRLKVESMFETLLQGITKMDSLAER